MHFTLSDIQKLQEKGLIRGYVDSGPAKPSKASTKSKYGNVKAVVDGIKFDSTHEANTYKELKLRLSAGDISNLRLQVCYELNPGGTYSYKYIADFVFIEDGKEVVLDAKGCRTVTYRKKCRLMKKVHGIVIREV